MTRLVAVADLHGNLPTDLPEGDVLVIAGDVCPLADHAIDFQEDWLDRDFYPWLESLPHPEIIWIAGNHDFVCQSEGWTPGGRGTYLLDQGTTAGGLSFHGTPWVPNLPLWAFYADDEARAATVALIPAVDVVVSHGPPRGTGDRLVGGVEVGCRFLAERLAEVPPRLCVFGHIHEAYGLWEQGGSMLANVAYVDERYRVRPGAAKTFDLDPQPT
jgi:Icc-related predicted phosphoesterase